MGSISVTGDSIAPANYSNQQNKESVAFRKLCFVPVQSLVQTVRDGERERGVREGERERVCVSAERDRQRQSERERDRETERVDL